MKNRIKGLLASVFGTTHSTVTREEFDAGNVGTRTQQSETEETASTLEIPPLEYDEVFGDYVPLQPHFDHKGESNWLNELTPGHPDSPWTRDENGKVIARPDSENWKPKSE